jgi:hypothetical protein
MSTAVLSAKQFTARQFSGPGKGNAMSEVPRPVCRCGDPRCEAGPTTQPVPKNLGGYGH